jgi:hypothetical protein
MTIEDPAYGPLQIVILGFETTERFQGEAARELLDLRGRGLIRVLDARYFHRAEDGALTEVDLGLLLAGPAAERANPVARLLGVNGAGANGANGANGGNGGMRPQEAFSRTAGFAVEDLRRLTEEIGPGDHAIAILVEHRWAGHLREAVRQAGGRLVGQGFLTPELAMVVGAEIQARADAEAAIELAEAARGSALLDALSVLGRQERGSAEESARAAAEVVRVLVAEGFVHEGDAHAAVDALSTAGLIEAALLQAAVAEAEQAVGERPDGDPPQ